MGLTWRLLQEVWGNREGFVFLPQKCDGKWIEKAGYGWPRHGLSMGTVPTWNDQYFCPLVFSSPRRSKEGALPTHVLWADLDDADPAKCALRPSAAWITTQGGFSHGSAFFVDGRYHGREGARPHWQALWFLRKEPPPQEMYALVGMQQPGVVRHWIEAQEAAELSRRIAYAEPGADKSGWDVTQVLRLPGTFNHKHTPPQRVELLWAERRYYTVGQVEAAYPPVPEAPAAPTTLTPIESEEVDKALGMLPIGLQIALERHAGGADRSLELVKLASALLRAGVPVELAPHVLARSTLARSKYGGRRDMQQRLLQTVTDAFIVVAQEQGR